MTAQTVNYLPYWDVNWQLSTALGLIADGSKVAFFGSGARTLHGHAGWDTHGATDDSVATHFPKSTRLTVSSLRF